MNSPTPAFKIKKDRMRLEKEGTKSPSRNLYAGSTRWNEGVSLRHTNFQEAYVRSDFIGEPYEFDEGPRSKDFPLFCDSPALPAILSWP